MRRATTGSAGSICERGEGVVGEGGAHVGEAGQAQVGLVGAVLAHGVVVGDARERRGQGDAGGGKGGGAELLDDGEDGFAAREAHFQIDLGELELAVGAQVFVAEAAGDLEVAVEAGDHEDLLEDLRRLRAARRIRRDGRGWERENRARLRAWTW